jgi:hypothetical protein
LSHLGVNLLGQLHRVLRAQLTLGHHPAVAIGETDTAHLGKQHLAFRWRSHNGVGRHRLRHTEILLRRTYCHC